MPITNSTPKISRLSPLAVAVAATVGFTSQAHAELGLEEVIVTGVARSGGATQMDTSISTSKLDAAEIARQGPRTSAEIFRNIPGIRSESSGGEGNSNISVRGLPAPDGGARYVQIQEDGLPIVLFGDMQFGTADTFFRADSSISRIEAIRGGSSSTLTSNGPGGTINFISKTGEEDGGSVSLLVGLDYGETRTDFEFGGELTDTVRFHIGGFTRDGEGPRDVGYNAHSGGQIKFNLTKEFDNGFIRVNLKHLDDRALAVLPGPLNADGEGLAGGDFESDDLTQTPWLTNSAYVDANRDLGSSDVRDGQHPVVDSYGFEAEFDLGDGWSVNAKHRTQEITGSWTGTYFAGLIDTPTYGFAGGASITGDEFRYVNGPNEGEVYTGSAQDVKVFDVTWNDMGTTMTDIRLSKSFDDKAFLTLGLFSGTQSFDQEWHWSSYLTEAKGDEAALIDIVSVDTSGETPVVTPLTEGGLAHYGANWGGCCNKHDDLEFEVFAPYAALEMIFGDLSIDLSVRQDNGTGTGSQYGGQVVDLGDINNDGVVSAVEQNAVVPNRTPTQQINWDYSETSYSAGVNYTLADEHAVFARISQGVRANADRKVGAANAAGELPDEEMRDIVDQLELGYKMNLDNIDLFVTYFMAETSLSSFDFTQNPPQLEKEYEISGLEVEFGTTFGQLSVDGSFTWTDSELVSDAVTPANNGNTPRRQAELIYNITAAYDTDDFSAGAQIIGTDDSFAGDDNTTVHDGFNTVGLFGDWYVNDALTLSLNINNLFDEHGVTEQGGGGFRVISGTTSSLRATFSF